MGRSVRAGFLRFWRGRGRQRRVVSWSCNETWNSPGLPRSECDLRLRTQVPNPFGAQGRHTRGNLLQLPPVLHRQAEADRYRGPRGPLPEEVSEVPRRRQEKLGACWLLPRANCLLAIAYRAGEDGRSHLRLLFSRFCSLSTTIFSHSCRCSELSISEICRR